MNKTGKNRWTNVDPWDRINAKIEPGDFWDDGTRCWNWTGARNKSGYGMVYLNGRRRQAYHATWELMNGPLPAGVEIDHLCRNPRCVNPLHLEPVTRQENIRRSDNFAGRHARQTHCKRGHEFTEANTYVSARGERVCRKCRADREYARRHGLDFETYVHSNLGAIGDHMREVVGDVV